MQHLKYNVFYISFGEFDGKPGIECSASWTCSTYPLAFDGQASGTRFKAFLPSCLDSAPETGICFCSTETMTADVLPSCNSNARPCTDLKLQQTLTRLFWTDHSTDGEESQVVPYLWSRLHACIIQEKKIQGIGVSRPCPS